MAVTNQSWGAVGSAFPSPAELFLASQQAGANNMMAGAPSGSWGMMGSPAPAVTQLPMTPSQLLVQQQLAPLISQLMGGGTAEQQATAAQRKKTTAAAETASTAYTTPQAFADASNAMALELQKGMQSALPAITRGMEGAGTSAGSMQALLAQQAAADAAMRAGALGADQASKYGVIQAQIQNALAGLATTNANPQIDSLLKALSISASVASPTR